METSRYDFIEDYWEHWRGTMTWKDWLGYGLYKKLWSLIGKRQWTYIRRDFWHKFEIVNIIFFVCIGFFSGLYFEVIFQWVTESWWHLIMVAAGFYIVGGLQCHFFWGTGYVPDQGKGG